MWSPSKTEFYLALATNQFPSWTDVCLTDSLKQLSDENFFVYLFIYATKLKFMWSQQMDNRFSVEANITEARMNQNRGTKVSNDKLESLNFDWKKIERCTAPNSQTSSNTIINGHNWYF